MKERMLYKIEPLNNLRLYVTADFKINLQERKDDNTWHTSYIWHTESLLDSIEKTGVILIRISKKNWEYKSL